MNKILCLDIAVCSSWGRRLAKHIFKTQYAQEYGHHYCLNCGITKKEARREEVFNGVSEIETKIVDYHSSMENPTYLTKNDIKSGKYRILI